MWEVYGNTLGEGFDERTIARTDETWLGGCLVLCYSSSQERRDGPEADAEVLTLDDGG